MGDFQSDLCSGSRFGGEKTGRGATEQNWKRCWKDDFKAFGAVHGSSDDEPRVVVVPTALWTEAAKVHGGVAVARGGDQGRCEVFDRLAQAGGGSKSETSDQESHQGQQQCREGNNDGGGRGATEEEQDGAIRELKRRGGVRCASRGGLMIFDAGCTPSSHTSS